MKRRLHIAGLAVLLLLAGFVFEAGHLRHHVDCAAEAAGAAGARHADHPACLILHTGVLVEAPFEPGDVDRVAPLAAPPPVPAPAACPVVGLPDLRAPPVSAS